MVTGHGASRSPLIRKTRLVQGLQPPVYTAERFEGLRKAATARPGIRGDWHEPCQFLMDAIRDGHPWFHMYRAHSKDSDPRDIEADLELGLWTMDHESNVLRWHHLKHVRRFFFRRYSFGKALRISWMLRRGPQETFIWLFKDLLIVRAALALLLGYALVFGSGDTSKAIYLIAGRPDLRSTAYMSGAGCVIFLVFLVYLNARNQTGRAGGLLFRALGVSFGIAIWAAVYCWIARRVFEWIGWGFFTWGTALLISAVAAPLSVLAQFFFGSERSLTDPL